MLLSYLYANFFEENQFTQIVGTTVEELSALIGVRVFPKPSYIYKSEAHSVSFVSDSFDRQTYRFHLRGHSDWYRCLIQLDLNSETRARSHFFNRYEQAKHAFFTSSFGVELQEQVPEVVDQFDLDHLTSTWQHFLNGVYGVCTRDGRPESIFLKQAGVMFVERMISNGPGQLSNSQITLLRRAVALLDSVESDFAPHEVVTSSRQRCIVDVRARFLDQTAA